MTQATFSIRMDEKLKKQFDELCENFGMSATTAFNVFAKAVVRERKIPFEISAPEPKITKEQALEALRILREETKENGLQEMSLDEINEEIRLAREERMEKSE